METKSTRKQHYVPQFYLRQWCDEEGGFYPVKIEPRNPPRLKVFTKKSSPVRFCYENFFYAQHTGKEDEASQTIEVEFAKIEGYFSKALPEIEQKIIKNQQITNGDKYTLSQCMIFLYFKGKQYREDSKRMTEHLVKEINKRVIPFTMKKKESKEEMERLGLTEKDMIEFVEKGEYSVDMGNHHHMHIMKDMEGFCNLLFAKYWKIYISREGNFITSDTPYMDIPLSNKFFGNDFFAREQVFILSPRVIIVALNPHNDSGKKINRKDITGNKGAALTLNAYNLMHSLTFGFHKKRDLLLDLEKTVIFLDNQHKTNLSTKKGAH